MDGFCNDVHDLEPVWDLQAQAEARIANVLEPLVVTFKAELNRRRNAVAAKNVAKFPKITN